MNKTITMLCFGLLLIACGIDSSRAPPSHPLCNESHGCPAGQQCLPGAKEGDSYCCGGPPCGADYFACSGSGDTGECAAGLSCISGACQSPSSDPSVAPRLGPAPGCTNNRGMGYTSPQYPKINGCVGPLPSGQLVSRCADGWFVCNAAPPPDFCAALPGFFASQIPAAQSAPWPPDSSLRCTWDGSTSTSPRGVSGCGISAAGGTLTAAITKCNGFPSVQPCNRNGWRCPSSDPPKDGDFIFIANDNPQDGVLCCKP